MNRRLLRCLSVLALLGLLFVSSIQAKEKVVLKYWTHWNTTVPGFEEYWSELAKEFSKAKKVDLTIQVIPIPYNGYDSKYLAALQGGNPPDLLIGLSFDSYCKLRKFEPFPAALAKKIESLSVDKFTGIDFDTHQRIGMPLEFPGYQIMYMNNEMFAKAGLDPKKPPQTMEELKKYAIKLTKRDKDGNIIQAGYAFRHMGAPSTGVAGKNIVEFNSFARDLIDDKNGKALIDSTDAVAALNYVHDMMFVSKVFSTLLPDPDQCFFQEQAAIIKREGTFQSTIAANAPDLKYTMAPWPGKYKSDNIGWSIMVTKDIPAINKKYAFQFLQWYLDNKKARARHYRIGHIPVWKDLLTDSPFKDDPAMPALLATVKKPSAQLLVKYPYYNALYLEIAKIYIDTIYGKTSVQDEVKAAKAEIEKIMRQP